jgi:hypothetical protein
MGGFSSDGAKPSLLLLSLRFMYLTPEMFCYVSWALVLEFADARTG